MLRKRTLSGCDPVGIWGLGQGWARNAPTYTHVVGEDAAWTEMELFKRLEAKYGAPVELR